MKKPELEHTTCEPLFRISSFSTQFDSPAIKKTTALFSEEVTGKELGIFVQWGSCFAYVCQHCYIQLTCLGYCLLLYIMQCGRQAITTTLQFLEVVSTRIMQLKAPRRSRKNVYLFQRIIRFVNASHNQDIICHQSRSNFSYLG